MAINYPNFLNAPLEDTVATNLVENLAKGYKLGTEPARLKEEQKQKEFANELQKLALEHKPKEYELSDALKTAQINAANNPRPANNKGAFAQAWDLRNKLDPNSPNYEKDKGTLDHYLGNLGNKGQPGNEIVNESQGIEIGLPNGEKGFISNASKPNKAQKVFNAEGKYIGDNVPLTPAQVVQEKSIKKFNVIYPFMNKALGEYSGQGSWERFTRDVKNSARDPEAKAKVQNYLAAKKLMSVAGTTENARIGGHSTNTQLKELKSALDSSEVNKHLESGKGLVLQKRYAVEPGEIFNDYLNKVEDVSKQSLPSHEFRYLNPKQKEETGTKNSDQNSEGKKPSADKVKIGSVVEGVASVSIPGLPTRYIPEDMIDQYVLENTEAKFNGQ